ncbi:MAG: S4 domain-containing protein, partial [bacterium]|nr:S4 domain-containing protein [bacterium]
QEFNQVFRNKELPSEIREVRIDESSMQLSDLLVQCQLASSKGEAKRLLEQKGVKIDGKVVEDSNAPASIRKGTVLQVGKRHFVKII